MWALLEIVFSQLRGSNKNSTSNDRHDINGDKDVYKRDKVKHDSQISPDMSIWLNTPKGTANEAKNLEVFTVRD